MDDFLLQIFRFDPPGQTEFLSSTAKQNLLLVIVSNTKQKFENI